MFIGEEQFEPANPIDNMKQIYGSSRARIIDASIIEMKQSSVMNIWGPCVRRKSHTYQDNYSIVY